MLFVCRPKTNPADQNLFPNVAGVTKKFIPCEKFTSTYIILAHICISTKCTF